MGSLLLTAILSGCGGKTSQDCAFTTLNVIPQSASADHTASPPANSQQFLAFGAGLPSGCVSILSNLLNVTWSLSDSVNAKISNAQDQTFGAATCTGASSTPITVTATLDAGHNNGKAVSGSASLTCK
ncbi:MAG: hypothetical protein DMG63_12815 [Acidobacteria bacterium]|nr:MAG: hypothetical protein DMG63_12815 [Acidobacteriota bacterium]